jgi:type II secretion system protein N
MELSTRQKKLFRWIGYPLLGLIAFALTITYTFPYERLKDQLVAELERDYDVSIAKLGPTLVPGGVVIDTMMLETRPDDGEDPAVLVIDRLRARVGLLRLITGTVKVDVDVRIGEGRLRGEARYGRRGLSARVRTRDMPLARLPMKAAVGLPMTGGLALDLDLTLPEMKWREARGSLSLSCERCTIGDGETQIRPRAQEGAARRGNFFAQGGLTVPRIDLGTMRGAIELRDGRGQIDELSAVSADGELHVTGEIELADPVGQSRLPGCIRFRLTEDFEAREPAFGNTNLWMPERARQADGFYAVPTEGTLANFRWNPRLSCEGMPVGGGGGDSLPQAQRSRPSITLRPDDDDRADEIRARRERLLDDRASDDDGSRGDARDDEDDDDEALREREAERAAERRRQIIERENRPRDIELPPVEQEIVEDDYDDDFDDEYEDDEVYEDDFDDDFDDEIILD